MHDKIKLYPLLYNQLKFKKRKERKKKEKERKTAHQTNLKKILKYVPKQVLFTF